MSKRRTLLGSAIASLLVVPLLLLISGRASTAEGALSDKEICLDPGHGGSDPGAVHNDGTIYLEEADINLDVAYGLEALLDTDGVYYVGMTRTEDVYKSTLRQSTIVFLHFDRLNRPCSC